jgi:hypothetical protein
VLLFVAAGDRVYFSAVSRLVLNSQPTESPCLTFLASVCLLQALLADDQ